MYSPVSSANAPRKTQRHFGTGMLMLRQGGPGATRMRSSRVLVASRGTSGISLMPRPSTPPPLRDRALDRRRRDRLDKAFRRCRRIETL